MEAASALKEILPPPREAKEGSGERYAMHAFGNAVSGYVAYVVEQSGTRIAGHPAVSVLQRQMLSSPQLRPSKPRALDT